MVIETKPAITDGMGSFIRAKPTIFFDKVGTERRICRRERKSGEERRAKGETHSFMLGFLWKERLVFAETIGWEAEVGGGHGRVKLGLVCISRNWEIGERSCLGLE